jgi:hypothetical protein
MPYFNLFQNRLQAFKNPENALQTYSAFFVCHTFNMSKMTTNYPPKPLQNTCYLYSPYQLPTNCPTIPLILEATNAIIIFAIWISVVIERVFVWTLKSRRLAVNRETKDVLKSTGKLVGGLLADLADMCTLGMAKILYEERIERIVAKRLKPDLTRKLPEQQQWDRVKLGMSEREVGYFLGLPNRIISCGRKSTQWEYEYRKFDWFNAGSFISDGVVVFRKNRVIAFHGLTRDGRRVAEGDFNY